MCQANEGTAGVFDTWQREIFALILFKVYQSRFRPYPSHLQRLAASVVNEALTKFDQEYRKFIQ